MLVKYLRKNGKPVACVVAIGPGMVGYSTCNPKDNFDKEMGRHIAAGRAGIPSDIRDLCSFDELVKRVPSNILSEMYDEVLRMDARSRTYYKS